MSTTNMLFRVKISCCALCIYIFDNSFTLEAEKKYSLQHVLNGIFRTHGPQTSTCAEYASFQTCYRIYYSNRKVPDESSQYEDEDEDEDYSYNYKGNLDRPSEGNGKSLAMNHRPLQWAPTNDQDPRICDGYFDAVTSFEGAILIFKKNYVWKLTQNHKIIGGCPQKLREMFPFLPWFVKSIDAAYERNTDKSLVLFAGKKFWVYNGKRVIDGTPKPITHYGIASYIPKINAAMYWPRTRRTYLFGDNTFWRYDDSTKKLDECYPKPMSHWRGIPTTLDAATTLPNGKTYFFKNNQYWLFDNSCFRPVPGYPRPAAQAWLGCPSERRVHP